MGGSTTSDLDEIEDDEFRVKSAKRLADFFGVNFSVIHEWIRKGMPRRAVDPDNSQAGYTYLMRDAVEYYARFEVAHKLIKEANKEWVAERKELQSQISKLKRHNEKLKKKVESQSVPFNASEDDEAPPTKEQLEYEKLKQQVRDKEIDFAVRVGTVLPRDEVIEVIHRICRFIREAGERIQEKYGNDAQSILLEALSDAEKEESKYFDDDEARS